MNNKGAEEEYDWEQTGSVAQYLLEALPPPRHCPVPNPTYRVDAHACLAERVRAISECMKRCMNSKSQGLRWLVPRP